MNQGDTKEPIKLPGESDKSYEARLAETSKYKVQVLIFTRTGMQMAGFMFINKGSRFTDALRNEKSDFITLADMIVKRKNAPDLKIDYGLINKDEIMLMTEVSAVQSE